MINPNPYLIALDLDGTLLTNEKRISPLTKQAIIKAKENGHIVVIATGRPYRASISIYKELGLNTPMINFNGALVHHPNDQSFGIFHHPLSLKTAREIIDLCQRPHIQNLLVEVKDDVYMQHYDHDMMNMFSMGDPTFKTGNLKHLISDDPTSMLIYPKESYIHDIQEALKSSHAEVIQHRTWAPPLKMIEIVKSGLNKGIALKQVANYYHIPKERIIAFGDEDNDLEMIEFAGHGIAMGNAIHEVKQMANYVTKRNNEDGIAFYLKELHVV